MNNAIKFPRSIGKTVHRRHAPTLYCYTWKLFQVGDRWVTTKDLIPWKGERTKVMTKREAEEMARERNAAIKAEGL